MPFANSEFNLQRAHTESSMLTVARSSTNENIQLATNIICQTNAKQTVRHRRMLILFHRAHKTFRYCAGAYNVHRFKLLSIKIRI